MNECMIFESCNFPLGHFYAAAIRTSLLVKDGKCSLMQMVQEHDSHILVTSVNCNYWNLQKFCDNNSCFNYLDVCVVFMYSIAIASNFIFFFVHCTLWSSALSFKIFIPSKSPFLNKLSLVWNVLLKVSHRAAFKTLQKITYINCYPSRMQLYLLNNAQYECHFPNNYKVYSDFEIMLRVQWGKLR